MSPPELDDMPYERFIDAQHDRRDGDPGSDVYNKHTRIMWEAAKIALMNVRSGQPLDVEIAVWLSSILDEILANKSCAEFDFLRVAGGGRDTDLLKEAKRIAATYRQAVSAGDIEDRKPIKTLCKKLGCGEQTVRDWINNCPDDLWVNYRPEELLENRIKCLERNLKWASAVIKRFSKTEDSIKIRDKRPRKDTPPAVASRKKK